MASVGQGGAVRNDRCLVDGCESIFTQDVDFDVDFTFNHLPEMTLLARTSMPLCEKHSLGLIAVWRAVSITARESRGSKKRRFIPFTKGRKKFGDPPIPVPDPLKGV